MIPLKGVYTALITPFDKEGNLDEEGLRQLIRHQIDNQIDGVVLLGSTGESPTVTKEEQKRIILTGREETSNKTLFMIGTGSYSTAQTIENSVLAQKLGADCALVVTPYYNKPTQEGLYQHFKALAKAVDLPIVIYNPPHRTGQNLLTETLKRLLDIPTIIGIKESTGNITQMSEVVEVVREWRPEFNVLTGDDALTLSMMALGGCGVISVVSNLIPAKIKELYLAAANGDFALARDLHYRLMPLFKAAFIETNPIPIKAAMNLCGFPAGECRLPLCALSVENMSELQLTLSSNLYFDVFNRMTKQH
ncbi:MAG: 4-hydroxy-tetrahydrodipicolinate synthase [Parachlamydiaceae bacterium]|nr:4-hydroxy-tetrahydrodipicolinate synthase [Parachlamydiaceae bacterium]